MGLLHRNLLTRARAAVGLGCAKTRACCGAVECDSQMPDVIVSPREAHDTLPTDGRPQGLANWVFPRLFVCGYPSPPCYHVSSTLAIRWPQRNRILTVFALNTFLHNQGHPLTKSWASPLAVATVGLPSSTDTLRATRRDGEKVPNPEVPTPALCRGNTSIDHWTAVLSWESSHGQSLRPQDR
jgi:hypothetical protein